MNMFFAENKNFDKNICFSLINELVILKLQ